MARIVAIADAHLGCSHYQVVDEAGLNQREADYTASWHRAVDAALGLNPDAILLLGDLFDAPRPTYRAFREGARGLRRIADARVPALAISGNHDTPRLRESGAPYAVLADAFPGLRFVYRGDWEPVELLPGVLVHAVPQCTDDAELKARVDQAAAARSAEHLNLLVAHVALDLLAARYRYGDVNELTADLATLETGFDRVLLGHFHNFAKVGEGAWYAGATDTFTFKDLPKGDEPATKGVVLLDTASGRVRHNPVPGGRPLVTASVDAFGLALPEVYEAVGAQGARTAAGGAVVRVFIDKTSSEIRRLLDRNIVTEAFAGALHVQVTVEALPEEGVSQLAGEPAASLETEWDRFLEGVPIEGYDRRRLAALGREFLLAAEEGAA